MKTDKDILISRFAGMVNRCYNVNAPDYQKYGALGVTICDEWRSDPTTFIDWALANGFASDLVIDKDMLCDYLGIYPKVYSPATCKWVTVAENTAYVNSTRNYRKVVQYDLNGTFIAEHRHCLEASIATSVDATNINRVCNRERSTAGNYQWKWQDDLTEVGVFDKNSYRFSKPVLQIDKLTDEVVAEFASSEEAARVLNKSANPIRQVCNGTILPSGNTRQTAYGYKWKFKLADRKQYYNQIRSTGAVARDTFDKLILNRKEIQT